MNTEKTLREKAMHYWNNQISEFGQHTLTSIHYPNRYHRSLTGSEIERIYLSEHPQETKDNGIIEGLEYKDIEPIAEKYRENEGFTDDANISYCSGFKQGANWFADTHYKPLLELCSELFSGYMMNQYKEANKWGLSDERRDEIINSNTIVINARKFLNK